MRPARRFAVLRVRAERRLDRLRSLGAAACLQGTPAARREITFVTLEVHNLWLNFCRSYFLSCILRPERENGGVVIASKFTGNGFNDAIAVAMKRHKPRVQPTAAGTWRRRDEPAWQDTSVFTSSCQDLGCSNLNAIHAALSIGSRVFQDLPVFRNFFAHRNESSSDSARSVASAYSIASTRRHPTQILASHPYGRPVPLLVDWIDDIAITIQLICN